MAFDFCPVTGKRSYKWAGEAVRVALKMSKPNTHGSRRKRSLLSHYQCKHCNGYHLTSRRWG